MSISKVKVIVTRTANYSEDVSKFDNVTGALGLPGLSNVMSPQFLIYFVPSLCHYGNMAP